jgi:hypothetical protein
VVAAFAFLGFAGAVFLPLRYDVKPIVVSFLLATGIAALTYRYLGGIEGASFTVGLLKLTGTLGALVGIAMLINAELVNQNDVQVWYLRGRVTNFEKAADDKLVDDDVSVYPANARADQLGDFHAEFIRHPSQPQDYPLYLRVQHKGFDPITIPLQPDQLTGIPGASVQRNHINIDHIVLPQGHADSKNSQSDVAAGAVARPLKPEQLKLYTTTTFAKSASPSFGGVPQ